MHGGSRGIWVTIGARARAANTSFSGRAGDPAFATTSRGVIHTNVCRHHIARKGKKENDTVDKKYIYVHKICLRQKKISIKFIVWWSISLHETHTVKS